MYVAIVEVQYYLSMPFDLPSGDLYSHKVKVACDDEDYDKMAAIALQDLLKSVANEYLDSDNIDYMFSTKKSLDKMLNDTDIGDFGIYDLVRSMVAITSYNIYDIDNNNCIAELH